MAVCVDVPVCVSVVVVLVCVHACVCAHTLLVKCFRFVLNTFPSRWPFCFVFFFSEIFVRKFVPLAKLIFVKL